MGWGGENVQLFQMHHSKSSNFSNLAENVHFYKRYRTIPRYARPSPVPFSEGQEVEQEILQHTSCLRCYGVGVANGATDSLRATLS